MEDTFYASRKDIIDKRFMDIKEGKAKDILIKHDNMYRPHNTWCTGVRWDICSQNDLVEIVLVMLCYPSIFLNLIRRVWQCLGTEPLVGICKLFCEDYGGRCSGVPDLIVWNYEKKLCKFVEVKGPGDIASENQKVHQVFCVLLPAILTTI